MVSDQRISRPVRELRRLSLLLTFLLPLHLACPGVRGAAVPASGTTTFVFEANRIYAELGFVRPDGAVRRALAFVDSGSPSMIVSEELLKELQLGAKKRLTFRVGELPVEVDAGVGGLKLKQIGAFAIGPSKTNWDFVQWYSQKNPGPVIGWLGANVLRGFRITLDYANRTSYWLKQADLDEHDLDQVGLTLQSKHGFFVSAIVAQKGKPTVDGVQIGDKLLKIGELDTNGATWGQVFAAMHGKPDEMRTLVLERDGKRFTVSAKVMSF